MMRQKEPLQRRIIQTMEEWLDREDAINREDRLSRLDWIARKMPEVEYLRFNGRAITKFLFEEARYCYVYGQFLAVIILGLSYIENTLAALFHAAGRDDLERSNVSKLLREALNVGWVTQGEFDDLDRAREIRNSITHFRNPAHEDNVEYRAVIQDELPYEIIAEDARHVMETVFHLLGKTAI